MIVLDMNDWAGCLHTKQDVQTPNIDRLAEQGVVYKRSHNTGANASCGYTPANNRVLASGNGVQWKQYRGFFYPNAQMAIVAGGGRFIITCLDLLVVRLG